MQASGATAHVSPAELAEELLALWHHLMKGGSKALYELLDELDVSFSHVKALHALVDLDRPVSVKELAEDVGMSLPGASRLVEQLHQRGLVDRREDPADRRTKRLLPTAAGLAAVERIDTARLQSLQAYTAALSPGQRDRLSAALADLPHLSPEEPRMTRRLALHDGNRRWWTLGAMCFALFMIMLDNTVVNVALPSIQRDLGASISGLEWTVNAYTLAFAVLLVTGGRLGDIFGRRRVFLFGVVTFALSSALIGFAQSDTWLVAWRAVQGAGAAFMMPATLSIIANAFPPAERGKAIGTWAGVSALALAIGPVVGGFLVEHVSWQSIFFLNLPVAAAAVAVTLWAAHESRDESSSHVVDYGGVATITVGLSALVLALVEGNAWGWGSAPHRRPPRRRRRRARRASCSSSAAAASRWSTSRSSARGRSWARTSWPSSCPSRCWRCSSSSPCTSRTSRGTRRWRPACASCPRPS